MALSQRLQLRQAQSLVMTPQLQQAIKLLQMSNIELSAYVEQQLAENPLLDIGPSEDNPSVPPSEPTVETLPDTGDAADVVQHEGSFGEQLEAADTDYGNVWDDSPLGAHLGGEQGGEGSSLVWHGHGGSFAEESGQAWEAFTEQPVSLREHLEIQINLEFADPILRRVALVLADYLNEAGYFSGDFGELAYLLGVDQETMEHVHRRFLMLDPTGIGARTVSECLGAQLREAVHLDDRLQILLDRLDLIARGEFQQMAKLCGVGLHELQAMLERLKRCAPRPAAAFDHEPAVTVIPDAVVRRSRDGGWHVELNPEALPRVLVNRSYYANIRRRVHDKREIEFVTEQWQTANWLIKALDQRANTILKVTTCMVQAQDRFFEEGVSGLRPMTLRDVAEEIDMHESTVSRVTSGKYIATPRGTLELKFFFSNAIAAANGAEAHSAEAVRYRLRQVIGSETAANVLSDENLVELLGKEGITVARRTVAKYRESMNIPPSSRRRRLLKLAAG